MKFPIHTPETAPLGSRTALAEINKRYGFIPNLAGVFAQSPGAMNAMLGLLAAYDSPELKLSPIERQLVLLTTSVANRCSYCTAAHSMLLDKLGLARSDIDHIQQSEPVSDKKLESLRRFVLAVVSSQGWPGEKELALFSGAGYGEAEVLEVLLGIAAKTLTNYTNHIAQPPTNEQFSAYLPNWPKAA